MDVRTAAAICGKGLVQHISAYAFTVTAPQTHSYLDHIAIDYPNSDTNKTTTWCVHTALLNVQMAGHPHGSSVEPAINPFHDTTSTATVGVR